MVLKSVEDGKVISIYDVDVNDDDGGSDEDLVGKVFVNHLTKHAELKLSNKVMSKHGNPKPSEWYGKYFTSFVDRFEVDDKFEDDFGHEEYSASQLLNSENPFAKLVCEEVLSFIPNLQKALGKSR